MKIKFFLMLSIVGSSQFLLGMHKEDDLRKLASLSAAFGLGVSSEEVITLQQLNSADIGKIFYKKSDNYKEYHASLRDDAINAIFFIKGPMSGQYSCLRSKVHNDGYIDIPLSDGTFHLLQDLYKKQNKQ